MRIHSFVAAFVLIVGSSAVTPLLTFAQVVPPPPDSSARSAAAAASDPLRSMGKGNTSLSSQARSQQDGFERNHRVGLRFYNGGADATCEVPMGRICYWNNNGDVPPPAERNDARLEREQLLDVLGQAQNADPTDDWVSAMRVRYAIEAEKPDVAIAAARACRGTAWWCDAIEGLALHNANRHVDATTAFTRALDAMPVAQRCQWTDLVWWLEVPAHAAYEAIPCANRAAENTRILRLAQPLWMLPANDLRNEMFARRTMSRIHAIGRIPYDIPWGDDLLESQVRFGWPTQWSVQNGGVADPRPPQVIGHEPTPSFDFMPVAKIIATPVGAMESDWDPFRKKARMRYAPRYAGGFAVVPHQVARFRRGDSTLVAGAYRLVRELEMGRAPYNAALVLDALDNRAPIVVKRDSAAANGALLATLGTTPMLASIEVLAPTGHRATRARTTVVPLAKDVRLSDYLLLQRGDPSATPSLERNALQAYGSNEIERGAAVGLYWEIYRDATPSAPLQISVRATRVGASFFQKLGSSIGLSKTVTPVSIRYADNGRPDGAPGRSIQLNFPPVAAGQYQLTILVSGGGVTDSTSQMIRVKGER